MEIKITSDRAVTVDRSPIIVEDGMAHVAFSVPESNSWTAIFGYGGNNYYSPIVDGYARVPSHLIKPCIVQLSVISDRENMRPITCEPIRIRSLAEGLRNQFEITGALSEDDARVQLASLTDAFGKLLQDHEETNARLTAAEEKINRLIQAINNPY